MSREDMGEMGWEWMDGGGKAEQGSAVMLSNLVRGSFFLSCAPRHTDWVIRATHLAHFPLSQAENEGNQRRKRPLYHCLLLLWYPKAPRVFVDELLLLGSLPSLIFTFPFNISDKWTTVLKMLHHKANCWSKPSILYLCTHANTHTHTCTRMCALTGLACVSSHSFSSSLCEWVRSCQTCWWREGYMMWLLSEPQIDVKLWLFTQLHYITP